MEYKDLMGRGTVVSHPVTGGVKPNKPPKNSISRSLLEISDQIDDWYETEVNEKNWELLKKDIIRLYNLGHSRGVREGKNIIKNEMIEKSNKEIDKTVEGDFNKRMFKLTKKSPREVSESAYKRGYADCDKKWEKKRDIKKELQELKYTKKEILESMDKSLGRAFNNIKNAYADVLETAKKAESLL